MVTFSYRLKKLRKSKGVTQKAIAGFLGITEQAYQKYEYAMHEPNHKTTIQLAAYFGVSIDYMLGRTDNPNQSSELLQEASLLISIM